jgi:hypothetical protein
MKELTVLKAEFDFLYEVPNHPLQQAIHDLHRAFANFLAGRRRAESGPRQDAGQREGAARPRRRLEYSGRKMAAEAAVQDAEDDLSFHRPEGLGQFGHRQCRAGEIGGRSAGVPVLSHRD